MSIEYIDVGNTVLCDFCNEDWTGRPESGGYLSGSYAICPNCTAKNPPDVGDIDKACPPNMSFYDFVVKICRGGERGSITFLTGEDAVRGLLGKTRNNNSSDDNNDELKDIPIECITCRQITILKIRQGDIERWKSGKGYVQDIFSYLSAGEREMLISGICSTCFDQVFAPDEEDDG